MYTNLSKLYQLTFAPCVALDCQKYTTKTERKNCRTAATAYCAKVCPVTCFPPGSALCRPMLTTGKCDDSGCLTLVTFNQLEQEQANAPATNTTGTFKIEKLKM